MVNTWAACKSRASASRLRNFRDSATTMFFLFRAERAGERGRERKRGTCSEWRSHASDLGIRDTLIVADSDRSRSRMWWMRIHAIRNSVSQWSSRLLDRKYFNTWFASNTTTRVHVSGVFATFKHIINTDYRSFSSCDLFYSLGRYIIVFSMYN